MITLTITRRTLCPLVLCLLSAGGLFAAAATTPAAFARTLHPQAHLTSSGLFLSVHSEAYPAKHQATPVVRSMISSIGNSGPQPAVNPQPLPPGGAE